jgi:hypothetical protein
MMMKAAMESHHPVMSELQRGIIIKALVFPSTRWFLDT